MNTLVHALGTVISDLASGNAPWALVGGLAVSVRSEPRTTRDVDVAVAVSNDTEAESLIRDLSRRGYGLLGGVEQSAAKRLATMRLEPPDSGPMGAIVDLLFASSGIESEICAAAEPLEVLEGVVAPVAVVGHLIAMKLLSRDDEHRPQDIIDLRALLAVATGPDIAVARGAVVDIEGRGFSRGRQLRTALDELLGRRE